MRGLKLMRGEIPETAASLGSLSLLVLVCLSGCGSQGPPTQGQIQSTYTNFWNAEVGPSGAFSGADGNAASYLSVASVTPSGAPTSSQKAAGVETYKVDLTFTFTAKRDLSYDCDANTAREPVALPMYALGSYVFTPTTPGLAHQLRSGGTFSCPHTLTFQKTAKGWVMLEPNGASSPVSG
jgi:hypothetical protein